MPRASPRVAPGWPDVAAGHLPDRPRLLRPPALLYLSVDDLTKLRDQLFDYQEFVEGYAARPTLPRLLEGLNQQIANQMVLGFFDVGLRGGNVDRSPVPGVDDRSDRGSSRRQVRVRVSLGLRLLGGPVRRARRGLLLLVGPSLAVRPACRRTGTTRSGDNRSRPSAASSRASRREFPDVRAGVTGGPAISNDEMVTAFDDSKLATALAFGLTLALLLAAFRRFFDAGAHAGDPGREPHMVARDHRPGRRPSQHLLGDVHLHRRGHRHRLRDLLPLPVRGGAPAPVVPDQGSSPDGRAGGTGHAARGPDGGRRVRRADAHRLPGHPRVRVRLGDRHPRGVLLDDHLVPGPAGPRRPTPRPDDARDARADRRRSRGDLAPAHHSITARRSWSPRWC